jgi:hypothetical protein
MEKYLITVEEKKEFLERHPVLACADSIGIDYDGGEFFSVKCKLLTGSCTYARYTDNSFENCRVKK